MIRFLFFVSGVLLTVGGTYIAFAFSCSTANTTEEKTKVNAFAKGAAEGAGLSMTEVNEAATVLGATLQNANYTMVRLFFY